MLDAGELGWEPGNGELIQQLGKQLGQSAYGAVDAILNSDLVSAEPYFEDMYVAAILINRLGLDGLISVILDDNSLHLAELHPKMTQEQITIVTQELLRKLLNKFNKQCREGTIPEQLKTIPIFDYRNKT